MVQLPIDRWSPNDREVIMISEYINKTTYLQYIYTRLVFGIIVPLLVCAVLVIGSAAGLLSPDWMPLHLFAYGVVLFALLYSGPWYISYLTQAHLFRLLRRRVPFNGGNFVYEDEKMYFRAQRSADSDEIFNVYVIHDDHEYEHISFVIDYRRIVSNIEFVPLQRSIVSDGDITLGIVKEHILEVHPAQQKLLVRDIVRALESVQ